MILADTSVWIEFLKGNSRYFRDFEMYLERQEVVAVEVVFGELLQGSLNRRERNIIEAYWENLPKVETKEAWLEAGRLSSRSKLLSKGVGLIDAFLLAVAERHGLKVWTLDRKLKAVLPKKYVFR